MSLLREIQNVWERTYQEAGINLEECLVGPARCADLTRQAGRLASRLSPDGRTFLQGRGETLAIAIYYDAPVIRALEQNDPRRALNERNISSFITFIEEITHGLQAALLFREGHHSITSESFARNLEVQAKIDTYLMLHRFARILTGEAPSPRVRRWLKRQVFDGGYRRFHDSRLRERYAVAERVAMDFILILERSLRSQRQGVLREFRALGWPAKQVWCERHSIPLPAVQA